MYNGSAKQKHSILKTVEEMIYTIGIPYEIGCKHDSIQQLECCA